MPSGKQSKQARRAARTAPPPVRTRGAPRQRQASPRVLIGAGALVLVAAIAIVVAVVLGRGSSSPSLKNVPAVGSIANGLPGAADVNALFKGIPQSGTTLGRASAPVTLTEYVDLQCPYCQEFETQVMPSVVQSYVRAGKVKVELRPWAFIGPDSARGQAAVLAAGGQNKAFNFAELLYDNQGTENTGWLTTNMVASIAAGIPGLHVHNLVGALTSSTVKARAQNVDALAQADRVDSTPTIYVGKSGTHGAVVTLKSPTDQATLVDAIETALGV